MSIQGLYHYDPIVESVDPADEQTLQKAQVLMRELFSLLDKHDAEIVDWIGDYIESVINLRSEDVHLVYTNENRSIVKIEDYRGNVIGKINLDDETD